MSKELSSDEKDNLHRQLVRLGDMMGDGEHHEPGGKWISKEYRKICRALGIIPKKPRRSPEMVNEEMRKRVEKVACQRCGRKLKQVRSGSLRASCQNCGAKFQLLKFIKKSQPSKP